MAGFSQSFGERRSAARSFTFNLFAALCDFRDQAPQLTVACISHLL
jgi:hypothetical protein